MSTCTYANGFGDFWVSANDPGNSEVPDVGTIFQNSHYMNTTTKTIFMCTNSTVGSQTWLRLSPLPRVFSQPTFANITTATQLSVNRDAVVTYAFPVSITTVLGTQTITATFQYADDAAMTINVVNLPGDIFSIGGVLSLAVGNMLKLSGTIPAGKYRKVTFTQSGGATLPTTVNNPQEVIQ